MRLADIVQQLRNTEAGDWEIKPQTISARLKVPDIVIRLEDAVPFGEAGTPFYGVHGDLIRLESEQ